METISGNADLQNMSHNLDKKNVTDVLRALLKKKKYPQLAQLLSQPEVCVISGMTAGFS